jgi:hypothetical protein
MRLQKTDVVAGLPRGVVRNYRGNPRVAEAAGHILAAAGAQQQDSTEVRAGLKSAHRERRQRQRSLVHYFLGIIEPIFSTGLSTCEHVFDQKVYGRCGHPGQLASAAAERASRLCND